MVYVSMLFIVGVSAASFWFGIFVHYILNRGSKAGQILVDDENGKILFNFFVMPDELSTSRWVRMDIVKTTLRGENDNSDNDDN